MLFTSFTSLFLTLLALLMPLTSVTARAIPLPLQRHAMVKRAPAPQDVNLIPAEAAVRGDRGVISILPEKRDEDLVKRQEVNNVDLIAPSMAPNGRIVPFVNNNKKRDVHARGRLFAGLKEPKQLAAEPRQRERAPEADVLERRDFDGALIAVNKFSTTRATRSVNGVMEYI